MNQASEIRAKIDRTGHGEVEVDGRPIADSIVGMEIIAGFGQVTRIVLHESAGADLVIEGAVTVVKHQLEIGSFLDRVDAGMLEEYALEFSHMPTGQAMIAALRRIARETSDAD